jgi:hypothetical protein
VPHAIGEHRVNVSLYTSTGVQSVTFDIAKLSAAERSRWLGEPATPDQYAMQCILHLQEGDRAGASRYATNCGPFTAILTDLASAAPSAGAAPPPAKATDGPEVQEEARPATTN